MSVSNTAAAAAGVSYVEDVKIVEAVFHDFLFQKARRKEKKHEKLKRTREREKKKDVRDKVNKGLIPFSFSVGEK